MMPREKIKTPTLETERLVLRPLDETDADALHRISNEPPVRRYLWDDEPVSKATIDGVVSRSVRMFLDECLGLFGGRLRGNEALAGFRGFVRLGSMDEVKLAYGISPGLWGRGLATEAAWACLRYAFTRTVLERVSAGADAPNIASLRVIEKLGMRPIGHINPDAPDEPYYALSRASFRAGSPPGAG